MVKAGLSSVAQPAAGLAEAAMTGSAPTHSPHTNRISPNCRQRAAVVSLAVVSGRVEQPRWEGGEWAHIVRVPRPPPDSDITELAAVGWVGPELILLQVCRNLLQPSHRHKD